MPAIKETTLISESRDKIREYILKSFLFSEEVFPYTDDDSLFENRIIDSLGILELVTYIEETFNLAVSDEDIVPENFDSINKLANYVSRRTST